MKLLILIPIITTFFILPAFVIPQVYASCIVNEDWPDAPCLDTIGNGYYDQDDVDRWSQYYQYKGAEFMEQKLAEMNQAIDEVTLKEWVAESIQNENVYSYYFFSGRAPDVGLYYGQFEEFGVWENPAIHEPFENNDVVIVGTVVQVTITENKTQYDFNVDKYLKGEKPFDLITATLDYTKPDDFPKDPLDYFNRPYFEKDNQVFVYLKQDGSTFQVSPYSFTIKKPTTIGPPTVIHPNGPQQHIIPQGEEIVISGTVKKSYLYFLEQSNIDSSFDLVVLNENKEQVDSKKIDINLDGSYSFTFQEKNQLRIPGKYSWEITYHNGSMGGAFIVKADQKRWTPLKQFHAGVSFEEIECRDGLQLTQKYDGSPACVSTETVPKLITRGWGTSDNWIKISNADAAIHYETDGAMITSIEAFSKYKNPSLPGETKQTWLRIAIESDQEDLKITLPRNLIDSNVGSIDDDFFVLLDGTETEYSETKNDSERILNFTISPKTKLVEIIGYGFYNSDFNELNYESLVELDKKCSVEKPGSIWDDTEKLCTYTNHTTTTGGHTIPSCNNGTIIPLDNNAKTVPVLMMQPNSTGTICITYNFPYDWKIYPNKDWYPDHKFHFDRFDIDSEHFTITANPEWIDAQTISAGDNVTVTYKIHADSNSQGLYDTVIPYGHCQLYPLAVGYAESDITPSDFPNAYMTPPCVFVFSGEKQVTIVSGMDYFELDYK